MSSSRPRSPPPAPLVTSVDVSCVAAAAAPEASSAPPVLSATPQQAPPAAVVSSLPKRRTAEEVESDRFVDEFGFEVGEEALRAELSYVRSIDGERVVRREMKWSSMADNWARNIERHFDKVKERARKGIPAKVRGFMWQLLCGSKVRMDDPANAGVYGLLLGKRLPPDTEGLIERDLGRTFPTHTLFRSQDGVGQQQLRNILHAYAVIDPEVGYVQGMGFIVGTLLTQMHEEEAFWCLHTMMHHETYRLREAYRPGFPMLQMFFFQLKKLIEQQMPKLAAHMDEQGCDMSFFCAQWFLTLFVYHFHFRAVLRVWDIFFVEGWKIIFRTALGLMKWEQDNLLGMGLDRLLPALKALHEGKNPDEILDRALRIKFKTEDLLKLRRRYEAGER